MLYELTLTLRPFLYNKTAQEQYDFMFPILRAILGQYKCSCIAELTQENNVHYHAKVELKNFVHRDKLLNQLRQYNKYLGRKTCTQLMNEPLYDEYMRKDTAVTMLVITDPYLMDTFEVFGNLNPKYIDQILEQHARDTNIIAQYS